MPHVIRALHRKLLPHLSLWPPSTINIRNSNHLNRPSFLTPPNATATGNSRITYPPISIIINVGIQQTIEAFQMFLYFYIF
jgi:hypothetical protein